MFLVIIIIALVVITVIKAASHTRQENGRSGYHREHSTNWNDDYMTQEMIRQHQQAAQDAAEQTMYAAQNAAEISRADRHRMQAQQMDIHLQMANGAHQKHIELCGQVQGQQDLQMFADHAAHGYQVQQDLVREEFGMFSDHNAGCTGSGLDPSTG